MNFLKSPFQLRAFLQRKAKIFPAKYGWENY